MKAFFQIYFLTLGLILLAGSCYEEPPVYLEVSDYILTVRENSVHDQYIGIIPSEVNNGDVMTVFTILSQSPENAIYILSGYSSTKKGTVYVDDETVFDFETNPIITAVVKVEAVSYDHFYQPEIRDSKTITLTINLIDLHE